MANVTIPLLDPITGIVDGGIGKITEIVLREPTAREFLAIGDVYQFGLSPDKINYVVENDGVVMKYFEVLLVSPEPVSTALKVGLADSIVIKEKILDFFNSARSRLSARDAGSAA